ncbi:hypothetical protein SNOG_11705 [Parastagonospora nodorum SN15]|uniref:Uncharacterized protein n=1 Tax=Phaeosphaeria nodorum (strain SN15 / ATCC MYA-4574 / FGSC 10173) TaxID=321614 RepID=Q0U959_PHANO|nr:hypothetical protein SNOG_11705 [Parastagonospora nodorum SN15]EAT80749.1 hypothetical protein SNOG_11705 [Parastagonospora nodorum SN15]
MGNSQCESDEEASRQNILKQERNAAIDYAEVMKDEHLQKQQVHRRAVDARREEGAWTKSRIHFGPWASHHPHDA